MNSVVYIRLVLFYILFIVDTFVIINVVVSVGRYKSFGESYIDKSSHMSTMDG